MKLHKYTWPLMFILIFPTLIIGSVYKWTDEEGKIHFGDAPPVGSSTEQIKIRPGPSEEEQQQARERAEQLRQPQKQKGETSEVESKIEQKGARQRSVEECFSNLAEKLGPEWTDIFEPISPRPLTSKEHKQLSGMFRTLAGKGPGAWDPGIWDGDIEDVVCKGTDDSPRRRTRHYKVKLRTEFSLDNILKIDADIDKFKVEERVTYLLLIKSDWLRFSDIDNIIQDDPMWDVEVISIGKNLLEFMRRNPRLGGPVQHQLRSISTSSGSFIIREWFYSRGILTGMRTWKLKR